jgi:hypothetical protein
MDDFIKNDDGYCIEQGKSTLSNEKDANCIGFSSASGNQLAKPLPSSMAKTNQLFKDIINTPSRPSEMNEGFNDSIVNCSITATPKLKSKYVTPRSNSFKTKTLFAKTRGNFTTPSRPLLRNTPFKRPLITPRPKSAIKSNSKKTLYDIDTPKGSKPIYSTIGIITVK